MVKLYALSTCAWCRKVAQYLTESGVPFERVDVDIAPPDIQRAALAEVDRLTGRRDFPVTVVGTEVIIGYKPELIMEAFRHAK